MSERRVKSDETVHRVGGYLHRLVPVVDASGVVIEHVLRPLMVELRARDLIQILVGSSLIAIPVSLTQEVWDLGRTLPLVNVATLSALSLVFIGLFVHFHFYKGYLRQYLFEYVKRVASIYVISLVVVAVILTLIQQCPWTTDFILALKRVVIVGLPASLSATLSDAFK